MWFNVARNVEFDLVSLDGLLVAYNSGCQGVRELLCADQLKKLALKAPELRRAKLNLVLVHKLIYVLFPKTLFERLNLATAQEQMD